ncbi:MAG TPA: DUF3305 domain-containing protein [Noviherbaspirillum sp.]
MRITSFPITVAMHRREVHHRWAEPVWEPLGVTPDPGGLPPLQELHDAGGRKAFLFSGMELELHRDETDGYFENWAAPEPKVFLMWRLQQERPVPVLASVSYGEGTRMLDSGELAGAVPMPPEIYAWLSDYVCTHYQPRAKRGHGHARE